MRIFFRPSPQNTLIRGLLTILIGVLILSLPGLTLKTVVMSIGAMIIASGLFSLLFSYRRNKQSNSFTAAFQGFFNIALGLLFVLSPMIIVQVFGFFFGLILLLLGGLQFFGALGTLTKSFWSWIFLAFSVLLIAGGLFLLARPVESAENILTFFGGVMLVYGVLELIMAWRLKRMPRQPGPGNIMDTTYEEL